jgi:hypothetical protein
VPALGGARALAWTLLALGAVCAGTPPRRTLEFGPVRMAGGCRLGLQGSGPACSCAELDARTRLSLGLPVAIDTLAAQDLDLLDGIGPARAQAIAAERGRAGPFITADAVARRVPGIGSATASRLARQLAGESGARCGSAIPER